jgi:hypothetical protein
MAVTEMTLPNLSEDPLWQVLQEELISLLDELTEAPKYREHVTLTSVTCPICGAGPGEKRELSSRQPEQSRTVTEAWLQKTIPKNNALGKVNSQLFFIL